VYIFSGGGQSTLRCGLINSCGTDKNMRRSLRHFPSWVGAILFILNPHEDRGQTLEESMSSNLEPNKGIWTL
jgi:hypothetical protein